MAIPEPVFDELADLPALTVAAELNRKKVATPAGGRWHAQTVIRVRNRLAQWRREHGPPEHHGHGREHRAHHARGGAHHRHKGSRTVTGPLPKRLEAIRRQK
jgi:hypothetical protein